MGFDGHTQYNCVGNVGEDSVETDFDCVNVIAPLRIIKARESIKYYLPVAFVRMLL